DIVGDGIAFNLKQAGGKIVAETVGVQEGQELHFTGSRPVATLNFYGGTLVVNTLGSEHTPYYLDQSVHTYDGKSGLDSILSPGDDGTYGSTTIVGKVYSTDTRHAYNIADGTIHLDMSSTHRDSLAVLGSMNMNNATFEIQVSGSVPISGYTEKNDKMIEFVTLATATEFYSGNETDGYTLFTGDGKAAFSDVATFSWLGDDDGSTWDYYIASVDSGYELRAFRDANPAAIPEPSTLVLMFFGFVALLVWRRAKK
ncbi:MAG: PEP-CTERM sorting domain-containing protein, partial [Planctomycetia bacterium]|nr:PEP-CTERM sorting domain-containing protein [Planctomycetia bacterium]